MNGNKPNIRILFWKKLDRELGKGRDDLLLLSFFALDVEGFVTCLYGEEEEGEIGGGGIDGAGGADGIVVVVIDLLVS